MKRAILPLALAAALGIAGCSGMSNTEQRVLSGGAIGAGVGAAGTVITGGCVTCGALIGGAAGAGAGYLYDQYKKERD
jgi:osmotically inducible lipoprotein OsmB